MVERLTEIWKASDGTYHDTESKALLHEEVVIEQGAINRLKDYARRQGHVICASGIQEALKRFGFVYHHDKDISLIDPSLWTGRPEHSPPGRKGFLK